MNGLGYDVVVPRIRRQVPDSLETQARQTVAAVRSKRRPRYVPFSAPPIRTTHPLERR